MTERPILFSAPMVRAILSGSKTQTRRAWKMPHGCVWYEEMGGEQEGWFVDHGQPWWLHVGECRCPYGQPGDRLWVRETHMDLGACYLYRADHSAEQERALVAPAQRWRPAIHMPRAASRITLEVTGVRVERLQDISEADAQAEGVSAKHTADADYTARDAYAALWEQINGGGSWDANPWVWVVEFRRDKP